MAINELDVVALTQDFPQLNLRKGDLGAVVSVHEGGKAFEVEFVAFDGRTIALDTFERSQVRAVRPGEVSLRRVMAA